MSQIKEQCNCPHVWKPFKDAPYEVSSKGYIRGGLRNKSELKAGTDDGRGYLRVSLKVIRNKPFRMHRLVAMAFLDNPENLETVDHIDGNTKNNCVCNLQWMNLRDNILKHHLKLWCLTDAEGKQYEVTDLKGFCKQHGLNRHNISAVASGRRRHHHGWKARTIEQDTLIF